MFQQIAVVLIVAAAVVFLLRRFGLLGSRRRRRSETFVPLASLRKPPASGDRDRGGCH